MPLFYRIIYIQIYIFLVTIQKIIKKYIKHVYLQWSGKVAMIAEVPIVACLPNILVQHAYLKPMR